MVSLPLWMITILSEFAPAIYGMSTWYKVEVLVAGAILTRGQRTVSAVLRVMGLSQERNYGLYHQVLSRAVWSGLEVSAILLRLLLKTFDTGGRWCLGLMRPSNAGGVRKSLPRAFIGIPCGRAAATL